MAIKEYNFEKYNPEKVAHLERHLEGSETAGSHFSEGAFPNARALIDYAYEQISDYAGQRLVREIDAGRQVGYDSLVELESLPSEAVVTQEPRGRDGYLVNMVRGVSKKPTNRMVIVAGPLGEDRHGFYTIFPGENAPSFPATREKLAEMGYEGEELDKQEKVNNQYREFWNSHGFVADD